MFRARTHVLVLLYAFWTAAIAPSAFGADCAKEIADSKQAADRIAASFTSANQAPKVGDRIALKWSATDKIALTYPVYLVVTVDSDVRFEGTNLLALTPAAAAPREIAYGRSLSRTFTPLHWHLEKGSGGQVDILPLSAKRYELRAAVIYAGDCGERVQSERTFGINVAAGNASLVVQDRYSGSSPTATTVSRDGRYELRAFADRFEVYDAASGDLKFARAGLDAKFSPTGRFLAARKADDASFEIFDLSAGATPLPFPGPGSDLLLQWANNDSYVVAFASRWGNLGLYNTITNADTLLGGNDECHACQAWDSSRIILDLDRGFAAVVPNDKDSALRVTVGDLFRRVEVKSFEPPSTVGAYIREKYDWDYGDIFSQSDTVPRPQLSHNIGRDVSDNEINSEKEKYKRQSLFRSRTEYRNRERFVVMHPAKRDALVASIDPASGRLVGSYRSLRPAKSVQARKVRDFAGQKQGGRIGEIIARSKQVGLEVLGNEPISLIFDRDNKNDATRAASEKRLKTVAAPLRAEMKARKIVIKDDYADGEPCLNEGYDIFDVTDRIFTWEQDGAQYWLINTQCVQGSAANFMSSAYLAVKSIKGFSLTQLKVGFGSSGGNWTDDIVKLRVHRLVGSLFTLTMPIAGEFMLMDTEKPSEKPLSIALDDAALFTALRLTTGGRHIVQYNSDDRFFVRSILGRRRVVSGSYVDDEVVVATDEGLYDGTFEGAQMANVKFEGVPGLHQFGQFEAVLRKEGLVRTVLSGETLQPVTFRGAPPAATLFVDGGADGRGGITGSVSLDSAVAAQTAMIFVDGKLASTIPIQSGSPEVKFTLPDPGAAHWVSAVVATSNGVTSRPSSVKLPGAVNPRNRLNAINIGIDRYTDRKISGLAQAKYDATNLAQALHAKKGQVFAEIETSLVLDDQATRARILDAIRNAAAKTGENDTLLISFAGHGVDGKDFGASAEGLYLIASDTSFDNVKETGVEWKDISQAIAGVKGTTIVILDACHSGFADRKQAISNDDAATAILNGQAGPLIVLAASKGRQLSEESSKGGRFTNALVAAIKGSQTSHATLDLGELYSRVKVNVVRETEGRQTPWLVRSRLVGEMIVF